MTLGLGDLQLLPGLCVAACLPSPIAAKGVEGKPLLAGTVAGENRLASQVRSKLMRQGFRSGLMSTQQGDHQMSVSVEHQDGWVGALRLHQGGNQTGDGPQGPHHEHSPLPVLSQEIRCRASQQRDVGGSSCLRCHGGECNGLRQTSGLQALKQWKRIAGQPEGKTRALIHSGRDRQQGQGCGGLNVGAG